MQGLPVVVFCVLSGVLVNLWVDKVNPPSFIGEVESKQVQIASPADGSLTDLAVIRFQQVLTGDPIAKIITTDPKVIEARLSVISAEVKLLQAQLEADFSRNAVSYERLKLEWMQHKVNLATSRVNLQQAESNLTRTASLVPGGVASQQEFETMRTARDSLVAEIQAQEQLVNETEESLQRIQQGMEDQKQSTQNPLLAAIEVQTQKLRLTEVEMSPITLTAPIDGMVSIVHRHSGENLSAGDPILVISSTESTGIVGYVPKTFPVVLEPGQQVRVRTRSKEREEATGQILSVGVQLEPIPSELRIPGTQSETGLPVLINIPPDLKLMPGEQVELVLQI